MESPSTDSDEYQQWASQARNALRTAIVHLLRAEEMSFMEDMLVPWALCDMQLIKEVSLALASVKSASEPCLTDLQLLASYMTFCDVFAEARAILVSEKLISTVIKETAVETL